MGKEGGMVEVELENVENKMGKEGGMEEADLENAKERTRAMTMK